MMKDISGRSLPLPSMLFDRESLSWRTCEATSLWDLEMSSPSFPEWGTTQGGELFELPTPERPTVGHVSSSLPTPHAGLGERGRDGVYPNPRGQQDLQHAISSLLPTPSANDTTGAEPALQREDRNAGGPMLRDIPHLLPTPTVMDMGSNYTPQEWEAWKLKQKQAHSNGNGHGASLTQEALLLLPTPKATNNENQQNLNQYGPNLGMALMPEQYQWTGENTRQQSFDGSES